MQNLPELSHEYEPAQYAQFILLHAGGHNALEGATVADMLDENNELWTAFTYGWCTGREFIFLRDLPDGSGDTIYILSTTDKHEQLLNLLAKECPTELHYRTEEHNGSNKWSAWTGNKDGMTCDDGIKMIPVYQDVVFIRAYWS